MSKMNKEIFHGGCLPCYSQEIYGTARCKGCQYYEPDWDLPDLTIQESEYKKYLKDKRFEMEEKEVMSSAPLTFNEIVSAVKSLKPKQKSSFLPKEEREEVFRELFSSIERDYSEGTRANHIYEILKETLEAIPKEFLKNNYPSAHFKSALEAIMGRDFKEEKPGKRYI